MLRALAVCLPILACGCEAVVQHGLDEREANEIQAALSSRGIESTKQGEGGRKPSWAVAVPSRRSSDAVQVLSDLGLPRAHPDGVREVYGKGALVPSASEERALYMGALAGDLSRTLESVEGVVSARVHLVLPPQARPGEAVTAAKAAVFLRIRSEATQRLEGARGEIRALVAGGVEGLSAEAVTLVMDPVIVRRPEPPPSAAERLQPFSAVAPVLLLSGIALLGWGLWRRRRVGPVAASAKEA